MSRLLIDAPFYPTDTLRRIAFDRPDAGTFLAGTEVEVENLAGLLDSPEDIWPGDPSQVISTTNRTLRMIHADARKAGLMLGVGGLIVGGILGYFAGRS
jgi:hypothetical protein